MKDKIKYIFVTGGMSGLGKGLVSATVAKILQDLGYKLSIIKIDPYLNVDAGTMSPYEHGEVFVTSDGYEADQDLGLYERFLNKNLQRHHNITSGRVYANILKKEREGKFLGKTVQMVPHVVDEVIAEINEVVRKETAQFCVVEIGGTVGDIESSIFLEAARMLAQKNPHCFMHVTYVPVLTIGEQKTKLAQQSVRILRETGIEPDFIFTRSEKPLTYAARKKIALFCNIAPERIISAYDVPDIYEIPINFIDQNLDKLLLEHFNYQPKKANFLIWKRLLKKKSLAKSTIKIGMVGKYSKLRDAYISIEQALKHCEYHLGLKIKLLWLEAENLSKIDLRQYDGILVPGGFGVRGTEEKIQAIKFAREHNIPFLGLCLGFQLACVEYARSVLGLTDAHSSEFDENTKNPVICLLPDQDLKRLGGTMRLGNYKCWVQKGSLAEKIYNGCEVVERHRHRYEFNNKYKDKFEKSGAVFSGIYRNKNFLLVETIELPVNNFFFTTQFHPEFTSRMEKPSPVFMQFAKSALIYHKKSNKGVK